MKMTPEQTREKTIEALRKILPGESSPIILSTSQLAKAFRIQPQTVRRGLCVDGHWQGLVPEKMPSGRLLFIEHV